MAAAVAAASIGVASSAPIASADQIGGVVPDQPTGVPGPRLAPAFAGGSLDYQNGPVMHSNHTHVIFWNPSSSGSTPLNLTWDPGYQTTITGFLTNVAADSHKATNVYGLTPQYTDGPLAAPTGRAFYDSSFSGAVEDTNPAPANGCRLPPPPPASSGPTMPDGTTGWPVCLTDRQLITELAAFIDANHLPTGLSDIYFLVTPDGVGSCAGTLDTGPNDCSLGGPGTPSIPVTGSYCGFHTVHAPATNPILWADIPYNANPPHCNAANPRPNGSADPSIGALSHEHNETITDPLLNAWINVDNMETGDLCTLKFGPLLGGSSGPTAYNQVIGTGHYLIQEEWSNEDANGSTDPNVGCKASDEGDTLSFSLPATITPGSTLALTGTANDPDGFIVSYNWSFGDGSAAAGPSVSHAYASTGVYRITLSTTDIGAQQQSLTQPLTVDTPPVPRFSTSTSATVALAPVKFNGSASSDPDGSIASYRWSFGDGSAPATGVAPTHAYSRAGTYTAQLTVTDNLGVSSSASRPIAVALFPSVKPSFKSGVLSITVNGPGTVIVGGQRKLVRKAATVKLSIVASPRQRRLLHRKHVLKLKLKMTFTPRVGPAVVKTITVTLRG